MNPSFSCTSIPWIESSIAGRSL
jgi:hypothetical protein